MPLSVLAVADNDNLKSSSATKCGVKKTTLISLCYNSIGSSFKM